MSWPQNETDVAQIRQVVTIFDDAGALADVCVPALGELKTAKNALGLGNAAGALARIGLGAFYYQGVVPDADTEGVFFVFLVKAGFTTLVAYTRVVGDSGKIWIVIQLWKDGVPVTGYVPAAGEVQITTDGAAWADSTGAFTEIAYGAYLYAHDVAGIPGFLGLKVEAATVDREIAWGSTEGVIVAPTSPPAPVGVGSSPTGILAGIGFWSV